MTMTVKKLHPSIVKFKEFVRSHPKLIQSVRSGEKTWQQFYEEWYLLGENDAIWDAYSENPHSNVAAAKENGVESNNIMGQMISLIKNIDMDQVQYHITNVTNAIGSVQQVMQQFKGTNATETKQTEQQNNPFFFQKD
ncbi:YlbD family protein [Ectobacillus polymachus]|uniref:YlbD family protein n=1 Tax=Ectobacillus polymachus TaxID=1508806 RepID=UPI003A84562B